MDSEEAKFVLGAYRPDAKGGQDPQMDAALEQARRDPELGRWLEEETAFDRAMIGRLRELKPPGDLRDSILAGAKVVRPAGFDWRPLWVALAACMAILLIVMFSGPAKESVQVADAETFVIDYLEKLTRLDHKSEDLTEIRSWIGDRRPDLIFEVPAGLAGMPAIGCRLADWNGREFSLVCFKPGGQGLRPEAHLFVFRHKDLPMLPERAKVRLAQHGDWAVAGWSAGESSYLLARVGDTGSLRKLF